MKRYLILEDGSFFSGEGFGASTIITGELAIQTANFGYQESITDLANFGKILTFTTPMIGASGINSIDYESIDPSIHGIIANDIASHVSDSSTFQDLDTFLKEKKIPGIYGVDTRALVKKLRKQLIIKASIMDTNDDHAFDQIKALVLPKNKTAQVSTVNSYAAPNIGKTVAVIDLGLKHSLLRELSLRKINTVVLPYNISYSEIMNIRPDAIIFSNGPSAVSEISDIIRPLFEKIYQKLPIFGIGLGYLLISELLNLELLELPVAYNGCNFPVINQTNNRIYQTAMNINQLVLPDNISLNFTKVLYDLKSDLIAGFYIQESKILATAFNPEGSPGNFDAVGFYDVFLEMME